MPLLRRQPFVKQKPPPNLKANDEVFFCKMTGEIFTDYEKFFERIILCNSLVWTCESTGHPGLTYQEAIDSEERVRKQLQSFPSSLQKALLFLAKRTHRSRLNDMSDDVYTFVKERYFVGEMLEVQYKSGDKKTCKLIKAMAPTKMSVNPTVTITIDPSSDSDSDVVCLDDPPKPAASKSPKVVESKSQEIGSSEYEYVVQELKKPNIFVVKPNQLSRKRGLFTRDKNKLYLKQQCHSEGDGVWKVKDKIVKKFKLKDLTFDMIFDGPPPTFEVSQVKKKPRSTSSPISGLSREDEAIQKAKKELKDKKKAEKIQKKAQKLQEKLEAQQREKEAKMAEELQRSMTNEERAALREKLKADKLAEKLAKKEEMKKKMEEERQRKKEERDKEREKKREEKVLRDQCLKEWSRPREDLECDDLKELPIPKPVLCQIPGHLFGDAVLVLEYLHCFGTLMDSKSVFPNGITITDLGRALHDTDLTGIYSDLVQLLLSSIFQLQEEEQEDEQEMENSITTKIPGGFEQSENVSYQKLVKNATISAQWPQLKYGCSLKQLSMDGFNLTEILRLHFLASGAEISASNARFNYQQRGGFTSLDDAGLEFRKKETTVIRALSEGNLFDLDPESKLKILTALINQLLTFVAERDFIEDNGEKLKACRTELRQLQLSEQRREKDEATFWWRKRVEERAKEKELEAERKAQKKKEKEDQLRQEEGGEKSDNPSQAKDEPQPERKSARQKEFADMRDLKNIMDLPTENIDWEKVTPSERQRIKELFKRKESELLQLAEELQHATAIYPLGRDRTFRRYWMFRSIPGLFIEDQEEHVDSEYLKPVPQTGKSNPFVSSNLEDEQQSREEKSTSSDKENDSFEHGKGEDMEVVIINDSKTEVKPLKGLSENAMKVPGMDTSTEVTLEKDQVLCQSVHDQIQQSRTICWSYINTVEQLDKLISGLNPRGLREGALKAILQEQKTVLYESLEACPTNLLTVSKDSLEKQAGKGVHVQSVKSRNTNKTMQGVVKNASAQEFIELNLREALLDLEERIYVGSLGALKVKDRTKWRDAIEAGSYNSVSENVPWNTSETNLNTSRVADDSDNEDDADATPVVRDLGRALVQIAHSLDDKYMGGSLGVEKKNKQKGQKARISNGNKHKDSSDNDSGDESSAEGSVMTAKERWQQSLLSVTSLPQIFLHMATLESSITWAKSALHTRCKICRRKSDGEHMLLCDGCDRGHHMYCLKPPVKQIPKGDWYCPTCRPKEVVRTPRKRRKSVFEESDEEEEEEKQQEESSDDDQESNDDTDDSDNEDGDDEESDDSDDESDDSDSDDSDDSDEEEEAPPQPPKIKFLKNVKKKQSSSGRSTPTEVPSRGRPPTTKDKGGKSSRANSTEPISRSRQSIEKVKEPSRPAAKRSLDMGTKSNVKISRRSLDNDAGKSARSRRSTEPASRNGGGSASKRKREEEEDDKSDYKRQTMTKSSSRSGLKVESTKLAEDLVAEISARPEAWPFLAPITRRDAPDYLDIIKKPMDLATVKSNINRFVYVRLADLLADVRLIFANCEQYNLPQAAEYLAGQKLSRYFEKRAKELKLDQVACKPSPQKRSQSSSPPKRSYNRKN